MPTSSTSRLLTLTLLAAVALAGCREALVADGPDPAAPEPPAASSSGLYIKGVQDALARDQQTTLRVQGAPSAVRYVWDLTGEGEVLTAAAEHPRELRVRGQQVGDVTVTVLAYDAGDVLVATGRRSFEVIY